MMRIVHEFAQVAPTLEALNCGEPGAEWEPLWSAVAALELAPIIKALEPLSEQHSLQEIECQLRRRGLRLFLIARKPIAELRGVVSLLHGQRQAFYVWMSTRRPAEAMAELLQESSGYADNFAKLADCGWQCAEDEAAFCASAERFNRANDDSRGRVMFY